MCQLLIGTYLRILTRVSGLYRYCTVTRAWLPVPAGIVDRLASWPHGCPPASHGRPSDSDPRDRVVEPARRELGRAGNRPGRGEKLGSGADQRTARSRLFVEEDATFLLGEGWVLGEEVAPKGDEAV